MRKLRLLISSILSGLVFAIGSAVYVHYSSVSVLSAAIIFSGVFLAIHTFELDLFTSKAGYLFYTGENYDKNISALVISLVGNLIGVTAIAIALLDSPVAESAKNFLEIKLSASYITILVTSFICGILMFIAVHGFKRLSGGFTGCFILAFASAAFLILGGEHVLLNVFCFAINKKLTINVGLRILISLVGNILGAVLFSEFYSSQKKKSKHQ